MKSEKTVNNYLRLYYNLNFYIINIYSNSNFIYYNTILQFLLIDIYNIEISIRKSKIIYINISKIT